MFSPLKEDPQLLRISLESGRLRQHLRHLPELVALERQLSSSPLEILPSDHGIILAPPEWRPPRFSYTQYYLETGAQKCHNLITTSKRLLRLAASWIIAFNLLRRISTLLSFMRRGAILVLVNSLEIGSEICYRASKVSLPRIQFSLPRLPRIQLSPPKINFNLLLGLTGQGLIVASIVLLLMTVGPIIRLQAGEWWRQSRTQITGKAAEPEIKESLLDTVRKPEEIPPEEKQFQLLIPKIGVNTKVFANIDAGNEKIYEVALKKGVAHAIGSGLPGEANITNKSVYIFGHSTNNAWNIERYNALFYNLKDLKPGDEIIVWFWGKEYRYKVESVKKTDPLDLTYLQPQTDKEQLILQTCWPPGTTWKRLLVIANPVVR